MNDWRADGIAKLAVEELLGLLAVLVLLGALLGLGVIFFGCATPNPTPPAPTIQPTSAPTPAFDTAACLAQATSDCTKACAGAQSAACLTNCEAVRNNTCHTLGGN